MKSRLRWARKAAVAAELARQAYEFGTQSDFEFWREKTYAYSEMISWPA
jgi:DNA-binding transcriptional regulator/RsmH inhibitor MraZ